MIMAVDKGSRKWSLSVFSALMISPTPVWRIGDMHRQWERKKSMWFKCGNHDDHTRGPFSSNSMLMQFRHNNVLMCMNHICW